MRRRVLIVDDDQSMCELLEAALKKRGFDPVWRTIAEDALSLLASEDFAVAITDLSMAGINGLELCRRILQNQPDIPVVVITAFGTMETVIAAIRAGAYDFISKPFEMDQLAMTIERAAKHRELEQEVKKLRIAVSDSMRFGEMLGDSPAMQEVFELVGRVANTEATVLITGESGTGKELIARALHHRGRRHQGPFVAVNCASIPETLLESELFGHAKGAFTDAKTARTELLVGASGGTLFLDEIGDMPMGMQVKLLRVLQERTVRPVGGTAEVPFDTRIVTASNRDLEADVAAGRFREDLFYRINVVRVHLPPLRSRGSDILVLAQHFIESYAKQGRKNVLGISGEAAKRLLEYQWPGNVRELQNCMERAVALTRFDQIVVNDLPEKIRNYQSTVVVDTEDPSEMLPMEEVEKRYILRVLRAFGGNKTLAARVLHLDRKTLYRKLGRYEEFAHPLSVEHGPAAGELSTVLAEGPRAAAERPLP
jgi:DNA-binding NtrC family response regulator